MISTVQNLETRAVHAVKERTIYTRCGLYIGPTRFSYHKLDKKDKLTCGTCRRILRLGKTEEAKVLRIYTFHNELNNYCHGPYDFIADCTEDAVRIAKQFQKQFNLGRNRNYIIQLDFDKPIVWDIQKGFINIRKRSAM